MHHQSNSSPSPSTHSSTISNSSLSPSASTLTSCTRTRSSLRACGSPSWSHNARSLNSCITRLRRISLAISSACLRISSPGLCCPAFARPRFLGATPAPACVSEVVRSRERGILSPESLGGKRSADLRSTLTSSSCSDLGGELGADARREASSSSEMERPSSMAGSWVTEVLGGGAVPGK